MNSSPEYQFLATLWEYQGPGSWHFITLPQELARQLTSLGFGNGRGFGSIPVSVTIGSQTWNTSIFPDTKSMSYLLPIKKQVRTAEKLTNGAEVSVALSVRV